MLSIDLNLKTTVYKHLPLSQILYGFTFLSYPHVNLSSYELTKAVE